MKTILVTCAIIHFDEKILAVQRSATMKLPLKWEFAGGKIEAGETEEACVKREVLEELNIHIAVKKRLSPVSHAYPDFKIQLIPYTADYVSGELKLREHADYKLAHKEELLSLDWAEADVPIVKELLEL
ncbi:(deoxy)nucleoside triphosphate pyrophosphohydrolase [Oceanihabitans sediminis]|uniref:8-oxo-dGTP diphosphatase n=1 Tax=Oceanihabitans sediminis TaxID=1812012 RepID=A0A368P844_9FLAO|nr:(deoxy)nucleoside triphosphate pyrophosphohydrolase [Oceanihabitans sediminis]MDX1279529.1 (deoxy)nucleoside triphosphate pyrophosphohydrolase [Oceanihabitans sediminis]MDX1772729.1 (deoxy)nucleoside triphosphate pyrophosphohydrolase [Oceanihabitans sediminis]RBP34400.1 8-oxo-dGTP diphosphatase [Oceanihabitans sediminis]RCU58075.1 (deoxy)nucleoside triphosphate pyrophosphohydrolase [Oceanihabitans sediminis]